MNDAREVLRRADVLRSRYEHADKLVQAMYPSRHPVVRVESIVASAAHVQVMREALEAKAAEWLAEAEALEATVVVKS